MYKLYERVQKSEENPLGSKPIQDGTNPFKEGPCLLCIAAVPLDSSVFGLSSEGMKFARLRTYNEPRAKFGLNNFPVKFLSLRPEHNSNENMSDIDYIEQFVNKYLLPLVSSPSHSKIGIEDAMRNIRNVNMLSYCDGTETVQTMEKLLLDKMQSIGYSLDESFKIQSQMCMIALATSKLNGQQKSTCISFGDINDAEVNENISQADIEKVKSSSLGEALIKKSPNESSFLTNGSGAHSITKYESEGKTLPVCLSSVVSKTLQNSIDNFANKTKFTPVNTQLLTEGIPQIMKQAENGLTLLELMEQLDDNLSYTSKLIDSQIQLLDKLEEQFKNSQPLNRIPMTTHEQKADRLKKSVQQSKKLSSEIAQIQGLAHGFHRAGDL